MSEFIKYQLSPEPQGITVEFNGKTYRVEDIGSGCERVIQGGNQYVKIIGRWQDSSSFSEIKDVDYHTAVILDEIVKVAFGNQLH